MMDYASFDDLKIGMRVSAEGKYTSDARLEALTIAIKYDGEHDELEGFLKTSTNGKSNICLFDMHLEPRPDTVIVDSSRSPIALENLSEGTRIKTKGRVLPGRRFEPLKIKVKTASPDCQDEIEGTITAIDKGKRTLELLGFEVRCTEGTDIEN